MKNPAVDAYIAKSAEFARPILARLKRFATAIEWMAEGKSRHWKYQSC